MAEILYNNLKFNSNSPKVVILCHGDADGLVATLIIKCLEEYNNKNVKFLLLSSMDVSKETTDNILNYICKYNDLGRNDKLYILDRGLPSIEWLKMCYLCDTNIICIDHHTTNHPKQYENESICNNVKFIWDDKKSAALLSFEYFKENIKGNLPILSNNLETLAISTSCWDIFSWKKLGSSKEDLELKKQAFSINSSDKILGTIAFYDAISKNITDTDYLLKLFDYFYKLNDAYELKIKNILEYSKRVIKNLKYNVFNLGIIYGIDTDYQSIISDLLFEDKTNNYDLIAFLSSYGTVSLRSKDEVDCSELAKKIGEILGYSGGGHKNAAGCKLIDKDKIKDDITNIFIKTLQEINKL